MVSGTVRCERGLPTATSTIVPCARVGAIDWNGFDDEFAKLGVATNAAAASVSAPRKRRSGVRFKAGSRGVVGGVAGMGRTDPASGGRRSGLFQRLRLPAPDPKAKPAVPLEEIQMRCSLQFVNEAIHCFGEGILRSPRDGDIGAIFGLGFPPFRGGPFRYVDGLGAKEVLKRIEAYQQRFGARWAPAPALVEMAKSGKRFYP